MSYNLSGIIYNSFVTFKSNELTRVGLEEIYCEVFRTNKTIRIKKGHLIIEVTCCDPAGARTQDPLIKSQVL